MWQNAAVPFCGKWFKLAGMKGFGEVGVKNLRLLWWLRNIAICGQALAVVAASDYLKITLPLNQLWLVIGAATVVNALTLFRLKTKISEVEFFGQLMADVTALAALLYFSGGAMNPFATLFILQVIIAATVLPSIYTWVTSFITIGLYTLLMFYHYSVPELEHHHMGMDDGFSAHIKGMWVGYILLVLLVAWFVARMGKIIRRQDLLLAESERVASLGTLATSAAHELGTPLATISILSAEMEKEATDSEVKKHAGIIREQVARCKSIITDITKRSGIMRAEMGQKMALAEFVRLIVAGREVNDKTDYAKLKQRVIAEAGLKQAVANILDNARNHSPQYVGFKAEVQHGRLVITVNDKGKGIDKSVIDSIGEFGISTRAEGLGMGLYLAKTITNRLGGELVLKNKKSGGVRVKILVPMGRLLP